MGISTLLRINGFVHRFTKTQSHIHNIIYLMIHIARFTTLLEVQLIASGFPPT